MRTIPAHVPPELVFESSLASRKVFYENVFETRIAPEHFSRPPVFWCPDIYFDGSGGWIVRRVEDLKQIYADDDVYSKRGFSGFSKLLGEDWNLVPTELGGETHAQVRRVLNPVFSPARMFALDNAVRGRARELVAKFKERGHCDFVEEFAVPFPVSIFLDLFGLPQDQVDQFLAWERDLLHTPDMQARAQATREVKQCLLDAIAERRRHPKDDLISHALQYQFDGQPWSGEMVYGYCFNLFVGGLDTVTANIGLHVYHLATHAQQQAELRADPSRLTLAIEEMLRAYAAVTTFRTVAQDTEFQGIKMRAGDKVATCTALTGRDPEAWEQPNEIRFERRPNHLTFGSSSHRCLGMHLARRELLIALQELLAGIPEFRLAEGAEIPFWLAAVIQVQKLPLVWNAQ